MKTKFNLSVIFCLCIILILSFTTDNVLANEYRIAHIYGVDVPNSDESANNVSLLALAECNGGPHDMLAHGWGDIYNTTTKKWVVEYGACAQCTKCNLVIITQREPGSGKSLGYYTTWQPHESLSSNYTIIHQNGSNIKYTSSTTIPGIRFRYS